MKWTKQMIENFVNEGLLTKEEEHILKTRGKDTQIKQGLDIGISDRTVRRYIQNMQKIYDELSKQDLIKFPKRKI